MTMPRCNTGVRINCQRVALIASLLIGGIVAADPIEVGFRGPSYPLGTGFNSEPTGEKPESKLWWNDGSWWGILWSTDRNAYSIHELKRSIDEFNRVTRNWVDRGPAVDDRMASRADVGWDGPRQRLYVASHIFTEIGQASSNPAEWGQLYRFSYNKLNRTYSLDFPSVPVTRGKSETLVLEKDSTSRLWVTWVENGKLMMNHSVCDGDQSGIFSGGGFVCHDQSWRDPFPVPVPGADQLSTDDISSIIAFNGFIGVMWSDQTFRTVLGDTELTGAKMNFAVHKDDQNPSLWLADVIFSHGDDHVNLKTLQRDRDGNVFAVIKTEKDSKTIVLLACRSSLTGCRTKSEWAAFQVFRDEDGDPTRPILLIDAENRELYVFATIEDDLEQRGIHYKKSLADAIRFPTGAGTPFIRRSTDLGINDATSTKQNLNSMTGLVVLASDASTLHYLHNFLALRPKSTLP
jgi:hypothetical protein